MYIEEKASGDLMMRMMDNCFNLGKCGLLEAGQTVGWKVERIRPSNLARSNHNLFQQVPNILSHEPLAMESKFVGLRGITTDSCSVTAGLHPFAAALMCTSPEAKVCLGWRVFHKNRN